MRRSVSNGRLRQMQTKYLQSLVGSRTVPIIFAVFFLLLFTTFGSIKPALLVFTGIPFAATGGVF